MGEGSLPYVEQALARAFVTALADADPATRERAEQRLSAWERVRAGIKSGRLRIGMPEPVVGLPAWATPDVMHGGFATGSARAADALTPLEVELAGTSTPGARAAAFYQALTEAGLDRLAELLVTGHFALDVPENGALLVIAWLVRNGDIEAATRLAHTLAPYAGTLRFVPRATSAAPADPDLVFRRSVDDAWSALADKRPQPRLAAQTEATLVWAPFADRVLAHWLSLAGPDGTRSLEPTTEWLTASSALLGDYEALAAAHRLTSKHRRPKENLAILLGGLREAVAGALSPRQRGLVQVAIAGIVAKRGVVGTSTHDAVRARQVRDVAGPRHEVFAQLLVERLAPHDGATGVPDPGALLGTVVDAESARFGLPTDANFPASVAAPVEAARLDTIDGLIDRGVIPSASELARLTPNVVAQALASSYEDASARRLIVELYKAFRGRRSLLLLDYARQTRFDDLRWVADLARSRTDPAGPTAAHAAVRRLGNLWLSRWPATVAPNELVSQFAALSAEAREATPFAEELAADIFMGSFSWKFQRAAQQASALVAGTLYARYYAIDAEAIAGLPAREALDGPQAGAFADMCRHRAGVESGGWSVAANGAVIEQAQVLTTHNLALVVSAYGCAPDTGWAAAATASLRAAVRGLQGAETQPKPLRLLKNAAYAWRQAVFYLSMLPADESLDVLESVQQEAERPGASGVVAARLFDDARGCLNGERRVVLPLYGWAHGRHAILGELRRDRELRSS